MSLLSHKNQLSLLSFNIQVGVGTQSYLDYVKHSWRHVLPSQEVRKNLRSIAQLVAEHDVVGLQEIDAGSMRSADINQTSYIAKHAQFDHWHTQVNRDLGHFAQHGLGMLSRFSAYSISEHKLPGRLPGRGALIARFGTPEQTLTVVITHLSLTAGSRNQQLDAICQLIAGDEYVIVMGDTNCTAEQLNENACLRSSQLQIHTLPQPTFPSWQPQRGIDHILTTANLPVKQIRILDTHVSDHRPVNLVIELPEGLYEAITQPYQSYISTQGKTAI